MTDRDKLIRQKIKFMRIAVQIEQAIANIDAKLKEPEIVVVEIIESCTKSKFSYELN